MVDREVMTDGGARLETTTAARAIGFMSVDGTGIDSDLCRIGASVGTDKSPYHISEGGHCHGYTAIYDMLFASRRYDELVVGEVGVHKNASMRLWRNYFPRAEIFGFEINEHLISAARAQGLPGVHYSFMDASVSTSVVEALAATARSFDIFIDDSSHFFQHQITIVSAALRFMRPGGILVVEDIFRRWPSKRYSEALQPYLRFFSSAFFVDVKHDRQFSEGVQEPWFDNDRLLVLFRNKVASE